MKEMKATKELIRKPIPEQIRALAAEFLGCELGELDSTVRSRHFRQGKALHNTLLNRSVLYSVHAQSMAFGISESRIQGRIHSEENKDRPI